MSKQGEYVRVLAEFVTGQTSLARLEEYVEERLSALRAKPEVTREKALLSSVELFLHEAEEGMRTRPEVYAHVQSILDNILMQTPTARDDNQHAEFNVAGSSFSITASSKVSKIDSSEARRTKTVHERQAVLSSGAD